MTYPRPYAVKTALVRQELNIMTLEQTVLFTHWSAAIAALPKAKEAIENEMKLRK